VIGVMPQGFQFPVRADLWLPLRQMPELTRQTRDSRSLWVFGRLRDDVSIEQARAELAAIAGALASQYPATNRAVGATVVPFTERYVGRLVESPVPMMMAAASFVLLIACANVANLMLARGAQRSREIALRASLGASRGRIARQLTVESVMLSAISAALAWAVTVAAMHLFTAETSDMNLPYWIHFGFDGRVFSYLVAVCVVTRCCSEWPQCGNSVRREPRTC
jgi:putative ABC transport system permease protein